MTEQFSDDQLRRVLEATTFAEKCADVAREKFDISAAGSEMMIQGYALLSGMAREPAKCAVLAMLTMYERKYVDMPQSGTTMQ